MTSFTHRLRKPAVWIPTALAAVLLVIGIVAAASNTDGDDVSRLGAAVEPIEGDPSAVDLEVLQRPYERFDGSTATLADDLGKPMVVNFFASWCAACVREMPAFEQVHLELADQVSFVGLAVADKRADAERIIESTGVTYTIGDDPNGEFMDAFGGLGNPTTVILAANGAIVDVHTGELTADELRDRLGEVLQ